MTLTNAPDRYGLITRSFHWLTALLILTVFPLGLAAENWPYADPTQLAVKVTLFSVHKTLGVTIFFVALLRLIWAATQPHPDLLNPERPLEARLAETVHWLLYALLVLVPLSGWLHHAASEGFAPIWGPFGQSLPFVPKSESFSALMSGLHYVLAMSLGLVVVLHVAGALKHHVIDRDATFRRMWNGTPAAAPTRLPASHLPQFLAAGALVLALGLGSVLGLQQAARQKSPDSARLPTVAAESGWTVQDGTLDITVRQFGSEVTGSFADWSAAIDFDETADSDVLGTVDVSISIPSLTLGSVTDQAMGADYFDAASFPTATFRAELTRAAEGYLASGTLDLRGVSVPVEMPFDLQIDGGTARMTAATALDRRDFHIGDGQTDPGSLGFEVGVSIALTATRHE